MTGILIISHGSRDLAWVSQVEETVETAKAIYYKQVQAQTGLSYEQCVNQYPIENSYLELVDGRLIQDGINTLQNKGVTHIHVLPLFISAGSTHVEEIKQAFGFTPAFDFIGDLDRFDCQSEVSFDLPIIDDEEVIAILERQLKAIPVNEQEKQAVLILGHGSTYETYYQLWQQGMEQLKNKLQQRVTTYKLDYASLLPDHSREQLEKLLAEQYNVTVIPLFLSRGYFTNRIIPSRLEGLKYNYTGETLLPNEEMVQLLLTRFKNYKLI